MNKYMSLLSVILLFSCEHVERDYVKIVDEITAEYKNEVIKQYNLVLLGEGGGMMGDIQRISLTFNMYRSLNLAEARNLIVKLEERYLEMLNDNKDVRPYLHNYPFAPKSLKIAITFSSPEKNFVLPPDIANVVVLDGEVCYRTYNKEKKMLDEIFSESYEDAYKIVYGHEKNSINEAVAPLQINEDSNRGQALMDMDRESR